ncbi:MAG: DUF933 domain-containing protein, partial [Rhodobacteraceae bacterium]|nr:DUF933 domain-containing protein [Paracoccaceae bacterium]
VCNVDEEAIADGNEMSRRMETHADLRSAPCVAISAEIEMELAQLLPSEALEFLGELGHGRTAREILVDAGYELLELITFFTTGPKETHSRAIRAGTVARDAAGKIHSDFARGFVRAEVVASDLFVRHGGFTGAREAGMLRTEGKDYVVQDGDVVNVLFNV